MVRLFFKDARFDVIKAFTLSEVLITLAIIVIVTALVLPPLVNNIQDAQFKTAYKKAFSVASQAVLSANQKDLFAYANGEGDYTDQLANFQAFMSQFEVVKKCINSDGYECWSSSGEKLMSTYPDQYSYAFIDSSGMSWAMYYGGLLIIFVDTNGFKKPNQAGKDRFILYAKSGEPGEPSYGGTGIPNKIKPAPDNSWACSSPNVCATQNNFYNTSWLYN